MNTLLKSSRSPARGGVMTEALSVRRDLTQGENCVSGHENPAACAQELSQALASGFSPTMRISSL